MESCGWASSDCSSHSRMHGGERRKQPSFDGINNPMFRMRHPTLVLHPSDGLFCQSAGHAAPSLIMTLCFCQI